MKKCINTIKEYLQEKGNYTESDDVLINEIEFNIYLIDECKRDIKEEGYRINITQNPNKKPYWTKSQAVLTYYMSLKEIKSLFSTLGITPKERLKLGFNLTKKIDEFDETFA